MKASLEGFAAADRTGVQASVRGKTVTLHLAKELGHSDHQELASEVFLTPGVLPGVLEIVVELQAPPAGASAWLTSTWGAHPTVQRLRVIAGTITVTATPTESRMTRLDVELPAKNARHAVELFEALPDRDFDAVILRVAGKLADADRDALAAAAPVRGEATFA